MVLFHQNFSQLEDNLNSIKNKMCLSSKGSSMRKLWYAYMRYDSYKNLLIVTNSALRVHFESLPFQIVLALYYFLPLILRPILRFVLWLLLRHIFRFVVWLFLRRILNRVRLRSNRTYHCSAWPPYWYVQFELNWAMVGSHDIGMNYIVF